MALGSGVPLPSAIALEGAEHLGDGRDAALRARAELVEVLHEGHLEDHGVVDLLDGPAVADVVLLGLASRLDAVDLYTIWETAVYIYIYIYMYAYVYIYIYIYIHMLTMAPLPSGRCVTMPKPGDDASMLNVKGPCLCYHYHYHHGS